MPLPSVGAELCEVRQPNYATHITIAGLPTATPGTSAWWRLPLALGAAMGIVFGVLTVMGTSAGFQQLFTSLPVVTTKPQMVITNTLHNKGMTQRSPVAVTTGAPRQASHGQTQQMFVAPPAPFTVPAVVDLLPNPYVAGAIAVFAVFALQVIASQMRSGVPPMISLPPSASNVHSIWAAVEAAGCGDTVAIIDQHHGKENIQMTYTQMRQQVTKVAAGLQQLGVQHGDRIGLFSENSHHWLVLDQAAMFCGAVTAVRGSAAPIDELLFILEDSGSTVLVVENSSLLQQLLGAMTPNEASALKSVIVLYEKDASKLRTLEQQMQELVAKGNPSASKPQVYNFDELQALGEKSEYKEVKALPSDLATLVYTSGTTGKPKGVMLTHGNLLNQINHNTFHYPYAVNTMDPRPGDVFLTILPCWHVFERATEYWMLSHGITMVYTTKKRFKSDLSKHRPHYLIAVPRIYDLIYTGVQQKMNDKSPFLRKVVAYLTAMCQQFIKARRTLTGTDLYLNIRFPDGAGLIRQFTALVTMILTYPMVRLADVLVWSKIKEATGGRLKVACSGGASLPMYLEDFYEMAGIQLLVGYGLTETSPVIAARRLERNIRGTCGPAMACTLRVVDEQTGMPLPPLTPGVVRVKGQQVTTGYYGNPDATAKAFDANDYFDTGDTGYLLKSGELVVSGRVKDIIVLSNGENVEPAPIEDAIMSSAMIDQVMLVGQGQRGLGALVVPNLPYLRSQGLITEADAALIEGLIAEGNSQGLTELADRLVSQSDFWKVMHKEINTQVKQRKGYRPEEQVVNFKLVLTPFSVENRQLTQTLKVRRNVVEEHYDNLVGAMFK